MTRLRATNVKNGVEKGCLPRKESEEITKNANTHPSLKKDNPFQRILVSGLGKANFGNDRLGWDGQPGEGRGGGGGGGGGGALPLHQTVNNLPLT